MNAPPDPTRPRGLAWLAGAEALAGALGFAATVHLARRLGAPAFAGVEYAAAVAGWLLVLVRGGIEVVVLREAARRPRLVGPLTAQLIGLKLACAAAGYAVVLAVAATAGPGRGPLVALAGLTLFASAISADVGPRALGRLGLVAAIQAGRVAGYAALAFVLVSRPEHAGAAVMASVACEASAALAFGVVHAGRYGPVLPGFRRRAWLVLARRGLVAGLARFARVGLYAADVLALGAIGSGALGPYAASRRVVFALVALGLVVPSALGPAIGRAWAIGSGRARAAIGRASGWLVGLGLPATAGLAVVADRLMPGLFGPGYRGAGPWLALVAARLVPLLVGSLYASALVAIRAEAEGLRLMAGLSALALVLVPASAVVAGAWGVGLASLAIELAGAAWGWAALGRRGAAPPWHHGSASPLAACGLMLAACVAVRSWPWPAVCGVGALAYLAAWTPRAWGGRPGFSTGGGRA
jgi:O-antigen/teichoic acid export membrane protein